MRGGPMARSGKLREGAPRRPTNELAFIDPHVPHLDHLLSGLRPDVEAVVLDATRNAPAQIADAVRGRRGLRAVHILAHGRPGEIRFGAGSLGIETIAEHA